MQPASRTTPINGIHGRGDLMAGALRLPNDPDGVAADQRIPRIDDHDILRRQPRNHFDRGSIIPRPTWSNDAALEIAIYFSSSVATLVGPGHGLARSRT